MSATDSYLSAPDCESYFLWKIPHSTLTVEIVDSIAVGVIGKTDDLIASIKIFILK